MFLLFVPKPGEPHPAFLSGIKALLLPPVL